MDDVVPATPKPPRFSVSSLIAGIPCAVLPFLLCIYGFGAYMRSMFFIIIPALLGLSFVALYLSRAMRNLARGQFRATQIRLKQDNLLLLVFLGFAILSWISGKQVRIWHCDSICSAAEPAIASLLKYQAEHGSFPAKLQELPDFQKLAESARISFRQGRNRYGPSDVGFFQGPDMVVYLWPQEYLCVVPLERPIIMSITRFYVLQKASNSPNWAEDHIIWDYSGLR
jgi:hypothetical protein